MQLGMMSCNLCPRHCGTVPGYCGSTQRMEVASVCVHTGEEPPLKDIVNVFFYHCSLHCIYCQNHQISGSEGRERGKWNVESVETLAERVCKELREVAERHEQPLLGLVTAAHYADQLPPLVNAVHEHGIFPTVVYNSSGYESVETLRSLEGVVDIYLPDYKYSDPALARAYSHAEDYPRVAQEAIEEMMRQVGSGLKTDGDGIAYRGLIVRHLVLPGHVDNSLNALDTLAAMCPDSSRLHVSLMAQYFPPSSSLPAPLNRTLRQDEYDAVAERFTQIGFDGWMQELDAQDTYRPNFNLHGHPFA